jgi:folate-binding protein YgfZ
MKDGLVHLDCHEELSEKIISHIKKYKMRLEINFELTNLNCYSNTDEDLCIENEKYRDTRSYILGLRIYVSQEIRESDNEIEYHKFRVANNIPEGSYDIKENELFPIYFKMHELNAISLTKGCYIGQEPTNRLFRTGVMRKKLQPFTKKDFDVQSNEFGVKVTKNGEEFGILCSMYRDEFGFILASE